MQARAVVLVVVLLGAAAGLQAGLGTAATTSPESRVQLTIELEESGTAVWTVTARYELQSQNETAAFDELGAAYEDNATDDGPQIAPFRQLAAQASERTGRAMQISVLGRDARVLNRSAAAGNGSATGVLELRFRWTAFARSVNESIVLGDAFGAAWELGPGQTLVIRPPEGYSVETVRPSTAVEQGVIRWLGPVQFAADEPRIRYVPSGSTGSGPGLLLILGYIGGIAVALLGGGVAVYTWVRRGGEEGNEDAVAAAATTTGADRDAESSGEAEADDRAAAEGDTNGDDADESPATSDQGMPDPELLSDAERVEWLLKQNDGRMKQAAIVEETGWSNAKVSQLLSRMADNGRVEKLRIGRENLIDLRGEPGSSEDGETSGTS